MYRIGEGYDVHKLVENRKLILGGVNINYKYGLLGLSDADVLIHAVIDSLLGASCNYDIGYHFPDTNVLFKNASSIELLKLTKKIISDYTIENIDATIICESPKLSPYIDDMRLNISSALLIGVDKVSVKATTEEGLRFTGSGQGIAAKSICLLKREL